MASEIKDSCEYKIKDQLASREVQLEEIFEKIYSSNTDECDNGWNELNELPLGFDEYKIIKCTLSTGGPADWIEIKLEVDSSEIISVTYHFADWFDHAQVKVNEHSKIYSYAQYIVDTFNC